MSPVLRATLRPPVSEPQDVYIVKIDTTNGQIADFITNKQPGQASKHSAGGSEHPSDVTFGPDGAMYIADWGVANVSVEGLKLKRFGSSLEGNSNRSKQSGGSKSCSRTSLLQNILLTLVLLAGAVFAAWGVGHGRLFSEGLIKSAVAGLLMGVFMMFAAALILKLPWYAPPRVLATLVMGDAALPNILEFDLASFVVGVVVLLVLTARTGTFSPCY